MFDRPGGPAYGVGNIPGGGGGWLGSPAMGNCVLISRGGGGGMREVVPGGNISPCDDVGCLGGGGGGGGNGGR